MRPVSQLLVIALAATVLIGGCATPVALRRQTVCQGNTVADIHQQQVLDNLAKFLSDPYAIPSFAVVNTGVTEVTDRGSGSLVTNWVRSGFGFATVSADASRVNRDNWTTTPVTDPRKLELMRCAYQRVLTDCGICACESMCCPDCRKRFNQFYTGRAYASGKREWTEPVVDPETGFLEIDPRTGEIKTIAKSHPCFECDESGRLKNLVGTPCDDASISLCPCSPNGCEHNGDCPCDQNGLFPAPPVNECQQALCKNAKAGTASVTSECLYSNYCWFCWSHCKKTVPKGCGAVGCHCGTYVWVPCGPSRDKLASLTLAILDYAQNDGASLPTKKVYAFLDAGNHLTTYDKAALVVTADVNTTDLSRSVAAADLLDQTPVEADSAALDQARARVQATKSEITEKAGIADRAKNQRAQAEVAAAEAKQEFENRSRLEAADAEELWPLENKQLKAEINRIRSERAVETAENDVQRLQLRLRAEEAELERLRTLQEDAISRQGQVTPFPSPVQRRSPTSGASDLQLLQQRLQAVNPRL